MCPGMHTPSYEGTPPVVDAPPPVHMRPGMHTPAMKVHPNAIKIGNPTSQCALLGLKLVQLSTLAGRIFFCHQGKSSDGVGTDYTWSIYGVRVRTNCVLAPCVLRPNFAHRDKKKILPVSVLN